MYDVGRQQGDSSQGLTQGGRWAFFPYSFLLFGGCVHFQVVVYYKLTRPLEAILVSWWEEYESQKLSRVGLKLIITI